MSDFVRNALGFDINGFMKEFRYCLNIAVDRLSNSVQMLMVREIQKNGNGSREMRDIAASNVKEISRKITDTEVELIVGIDENTLGGFTDRNFTATMVVLHGNVTSGPLMTKPGQMTWTKHVRSMRLSPPTNKDGSPRKPRIMPVAMMQYEMVNGFGNSRHMLDNILEHQLNHVLDDFNDSLSDLMDSIDFSKYVKGG